MTGRGGGAGGAARPGDDDALAPRALLLDFGSVISVSLFERHAQTERALGLAPGTLRWRGPVDPDGDPAWQAMQRDEIGERDYWALRARELGELVGEPGWDVRTMLSRVRQTDPDAVERPRVRRLIRAAREHGLPVGILSNELELFYGPAFLRRMSVLSEMTVIVDATHTGILKPDPRAYAAAVDGLGVPAARVLFVDDQFRNVAGAVRAGLQAQWFDLRDVPGSIDAVAARLRLDVRMI